MLRAPKAADGRDGDPVKENERDLRSADVIMRLLDGTANFHVLFSTIIY